MIERGLEPDFPPAAQKELAAIGGPAGATADVRDLRDRLWASIDNDDSRDLDLGEAFLLITAIFLGLPLTFESKEADLMCRPPRNPKQPLLRFPVLMRSGLVSRSRVGGGLGLFIWELRFSRAPLAWLP